MLYAYLPRDRIAGNRRRYFEAFAKDLHFGARYLGLANDAIGIRYDRLFFANVISTATAFYFCQFLFAYFFIRIQRLVNARRGFAALYCDFITNFVALVRNDLCHANFRDDVRSTFFFCDRRGLPYLFNGKCYRVFSVVEAYDQIGRFVRVELFFRRRLLVANRALERFVQDLVDFIGQSGHR